MAAIIEFLKSKGKLGGLGLILIGLGEGVLIFMGKIVGTYESAGSKVFLGLGIIGIRSKQDKPL